MKNKKRWNLTEWVFTSILCSLRYENWDIFNIKTYVFDENEPGLWYVSADREEKNGQNLCQDKNSRTQLGLKDQQFSKSSYERRKNNLPDFYGWIKWPRSEQPLWGFQAGGLTVTSKPLYWGGESSDKVSLGHGWTRKDILQPLLKCTDMVSAFISSPISILLWWKIYVS